MTAFVPSSLDPTSIFEIFRGSYGTELLTAATAHFKLFERLAGGPKQTAELAQELGLERRPAVVLFTALKAMQLLQEANGTIELTQLARDHLLRASPFFVGDYLGLAAQTPGVLEMVARLQSNRPTGADAADGAAFVFRDGLESAMEKESSARHFTLALAGRAKNVAPVLAEKLNLSQTKSLLDLGGGTGIYSIALVKRFPHLRAAVFDRPEVLKIAGEFAQQSGVSDRVDLLPGDMFRDPLPRDCEAILLSNILHDWDEPQCAELVAKCAAALPTGGRLFVHDVFLNDALDGPLPIALYSAALFSFTEGRAYSAAEYSACLTTAGFAVEPPIPTLIHCGVMTAVKRG